MGTVGKTLVGMWYVSPVTLPVHVKNRGIHFVDGVSDVLQLTAQAAHDDANGLRSAIIKQLGGLVTNKIRRESEYLNVVK